MQENSAPLTTINAADYAIIMTALALGKHSGFTPIDSVDERAAYKEVQAAFPDSRTDVPAGHQISLSFRATRILAALTMAMYVMWETGIDVGLPQGVTKGDIVDLMSRFHTALETSGTKKTIGDLLGVFENVISLARKSADPIEKADLITHHLDQLNQDSQDSQGNDDMNFDVLETSLVGASLRFCKQLGDEISEDEGFSDAYAAFVNQNRSESQRHQLNGDAISAIMTSLVMFYAGLTTGIVTVHESFGLSKALGGVLLTEKLKALIYRLMTQVGELTPQEIEADLQEMVDAFSSLGKKTIKA